MSPDRIIGNDGELLDKFVRNTPVVSNAIQDRKRNLEESVRDRQKQILSLMKNWENKKPEPGMAKEYFTLGKGKDRIIFCTNPLKETFDGRHANFKYLALSKEGFFILDTLVTSSDTISYVENPFCDAKAIFSGSEFGQNTRDSWFLHSMFRGQNPGVKMKLNIEKKNDEISVFNSRFKIGLKNYDFNSIDYLLKSVSFETAFNIFEKIQERVDVECDIRLEETNSLIDKVNQDSSFIQQISGSISEKRKRG